MNVYIGGPVEYSDMQGPCPSGFHVPLSSEWIAIKNAGVNLGAWGSSDGNNFSKYLKIPMAGMRNYYTNTSKVGSRGRYWASDYYSSDSALKLTFISYKITPNDTGFYSYGLPVRGIKNSPVTPTSSWTVLYQGSGSAGIYYNPIDGLISISSDGSAWYTLMDKNLGATTVYNYGDTLTDANCGNVFQRGNNYPFPGTLSSDSITTSGSQVDTTGYGPGNHYESSTWIRDNYSWFYPSNYNLRGGVSQGSGTKSVEVQNIYIGEYTGTVQTFDFQNDGSLNWTGITIYGTPSYVSGQGWTIATNTSQQSAIMPPSSVYNGQKLVKYKLRMYKSTSSTSSRTAGCGMSASSHSNGLVCCNQLVKGVVGANVYNGSSDTFTETTDIVGEATLEYYLNDDGSLELSINGGTKYNLGNFATLFRTDWQNNNLGICIGAWSLNSAFAFYVRKVEITTID